MLYEVITDLLQKERLCYNLETFNISLFISTYTWIIHGDVEKNILPTQLLLQLSLLITGDFFLKKG